jgi:hypothetical protein
MLWSTPEARRIPGGDIGFLGNVPASAPNIFFFGLLCDLLANENRPLTVIFAEYNQLSTETGRMTAEFSGMKRAHPGFCKLRKSLHQPKTRWNKFSGKEVSGILMG